MIRIYTMFTLTGALPMPGGMMQQPADLLEALQVIDAQVKRIQDGRQQRRSAP